MLLDGALGNSLPFQPLSSDKACTRSAATEVVLEFWGLHRAFSSDDRKLRVIAQDFCGKFSLENSESVLEFPTISRWLHGAFANGEYGVDWEFGGDHGVHCLIYGSAVIGSREGPAEPISSFLSSSAAEGSGKWGERDESGVCGREAQTDET